LNRVVPLLKNKDISLSVRGRLYSSCVQSSMLHGSETWPVRKENKVALQRSEMTMGRWMCGVKKCMEYEVEGASPIGRPQKTGERLWKKTVKHVD